MDLMAVDVTLEEATTKKYSPYLKWVAKGDISMD